MKINPRKDTVLSMYHIGLSDAVIAHQLNISIATARYYIRAYSNQPNRRQVYTPEFVERLITARLDGNLETYIKTYGISKTYAFNLIRNHHDAKAVYEEAKERGFFNPRSTKECYAVGISRNDSAASLLYLKNLHLDLKVWEGVFYLWYRSDTMVTRFPLSFEDEINIIKNPEKWLKSNNTRLKEGWQVVRKITRRSKAQ